MPPFIKSSKEGSIMKKYFKPEVFIVEMTADVITASYGTVEEDGFNLDYGKDIFFS